MGFFGLVLLLPLLAGCDVGGSAATPTATSKGQITVASKGFTEETLVGEMYAQLLEQGGYQVVRKLNLGETDILQPALQNKDIDVYPEYTGTGLVVVLKKDPSSDPQGVYKTVSQAYEEQFKLTWLDPAPMNDTQAVVTTQENSDKYGLKTLSDLSAKAKDLRLACAPAFTTRPDGLPGLKKTYGGFDFKEVKQVDFSLLYKSLQQGDVEVAQASGSTDGAILGNKLVLLQDDKHLFPVYQLAPILRTDYVTQHPDVKTILNALAPKLTDETMINLNWEVDGKKREPADVAKEFLKAQGLTK